MNKHFLRTRIAAILATAMGWSHLASSAPETMPLVVVLKDEAGAPAPGVGVRIEPWNSAPIHVVADAHGEVHVTIRAGQTEIFVDDPAHPPMSDMLLMNARGPQRVEIKAMRGTALTGMVVDAHGQPIVGAAIEIFPYGMISPPHTTTDAHGKFSSELGAGSWTIRATKLGKALTDKKLEIPVGKTVASMSIVLPDAASLLLTTDCKARGCLNAAVILSVANGAIEEGLDSSGNAIFDNLALGDATVTLHDDADPRHPIYGKVTVPLIAGGAAHATLLANGIDAKATISGTLVDQNGVAAVVPAGGQLVVDAMCKGFSRRAIANPDGTFVVVNAIPGICTLSGLLIDPRDPMSGMNGLRSDSNVTAPSTGVKIPVNDFFHH